MAELVYAFDLKSNGAIRTGSSPVPATIFVRNKNSKIRNCGASRASPVPATISLNFSFLKEKFSERK